MPDEHAPPRGAPPTRPRPPTGAYRARKPVRVFGPRRRDHPPAPTLTVSSPRRGGGGAHHTAPRSHRPPRWRGARSRAFPPKKSRRSSGEPMPDEHAPRPELSARRTTPPTRPRVLPELFARRTTPGAPGAAQTHTGPRYHHTPGSPPGIGPYSALACHPGTTSHTPGSGLPGSGSAISVPSSGPPTSRTSLMRQRSQTTAPRVRRLGRLGAPVRLLVFHNLPLSKTRNRAKRTPWRRGGGRTGAGPAPPRRAPRGRLRSRG